MRIVPCPEHLEYKNRFDILPSLAEVSDYTKSESVLAPNKKAEALVIGDYMVRYLDRHLRKSKKKGMKVCYPGAKVKDVSERIDSVLGGPVMKRW